MEMCEHGEDARLCQACRAARLLAAVAAQPLTNATANRVHEEMAVNAIRTIKGAWGLTAL